MTAHSPTIGETTGSVPADKLDMIFDILSHHRRRNALACLSGSSETVALADLAEDVAVREKGASRTKIPKEEIQTISTTLSHVHLPKLVEAGAVEYDQDRNLVHVAATSDWINHALSVTPDTEEDL